MATGPRCFRCWILICSGPVVLLFDGFRHLGSGDGDVR
jgi:hypothetical protein